ncbi:hypothetical protein ABT390_08945 [Streptomyces aurantiacus]|uniref:hypothetical protein n=1 Tax=Streptomyces aurantiacus TaxID=47760 RepID=UPI00216AED88|nr:hypothetical protein [Streptomyces aurantiacus]
MPAHLAPLTWLGVPDDLTSPARAGEDAVRYVPQPHPGLPRTQAFLRLDAQRGHRLPPGRPDHREGDGPARRLWQEGNMPLALQRRELLGRRDHFDRADALAGPPTGH